MSIELAPLRERKEDIPNIVEYFISRLNDEYGRSITGVTPDAMADLIGYDWPGNVRELRNAVERAMMLEGAAPADPGSSPLRDPPAARGRGGLSPAARALAGGKTVPYRSPPEGISMEEVEREFIRQALERHNGNQTLAARCLPFSRDTLRYRRKKFGLGESDSIWAATSAADGSAPEPLKPRNG